MAALTELGLRYVIFLAAMACDAGVALRERAFVVSMLVAARAALMLRILVQTGEHGRRVTARAARRRQYAPYAVDRVALRAAAADGCVVLDGFDFMA